MGLPAILRAADAAALAKGKIAWKLRKPLHGPESGYGAYSGAEDGGGFSISPGSQALVANSSSLAWLVSMKKRSRSLTCSRQPFGNSA